MTADPVPILGLTAAMAWISLVTVEFYERIYRERIEINSENLRGRGDDQLKKLISEIETKTKEGTPIDPQRVDNRLRNIRSLIKAEDVLFSQRTKLFALLAFASILSIITSYVPNLQFSNVETYTQLSMAFTFFTYLVLGAVFLWGFWFLDKMFWFDKHIRGLSRQILQPSCQKCSFPMKLVRTLSIGEWQCALCNTKMELPIYQPIPKPTGKETT